MNPQVQSSSEFTLHDVADTQIVLHYEQENHDENKEQKEKTEMPSLQVNKKIKKKKGIRFSPPQKPNGSNDNGTSHLRKGIFIVLQAPLENKDDNEYSYHKSKEDDLNPLWIAKIEKFYRKWGFADLCFYRAKGRNIIEASPTFELDNTIFRVYNINDAFQFTVCHSDISKEGLLRKLNEKA